MTPYCPSLDESIVPLNYVATYIIELDKERSQETDRLDHLDTRGRLRRVWEILNEEEDLKDILDVGKLWEKPSLRKSWADAERLRKIGNSRYAKGLLMEALNIYNEALCFLPPSMKDPSKDIYPLIIANRSLVLYEMGSYKLALMDIKLAQDSNYPPQLLYKLKVRQAACFQALGQKMLANKCLDQAIHFIETELTEEDAKKALRYVADRKVEIMNSKYEKDEEEGDKTAAPRPELHPHPRYLALSSKVEVRETEEKGRHVVAREAIKPGEVIVEDTAILGSLVASKYSSNCLHCLGSIVRIFPCLTCSAVRFCSSQCRGEASLSYHGAECRLGLADLYDKVQCFCST